MDESGNETNMTKTSAKVGKQRIRGISASRFTLHAPKSAGAPAHGGVEVGPGQSKRALGAQAGPGFANSRLGRCFNKLLFVGPPVERLE